MKFKLKSDKIWEVANLLRGDYKRSDYGKVILPLTVLRRLDCVLKPTKQKVLDYLPKVEKLKESAKWIPEKALVIALAGQGKTKGMIAQVQFKTTCNQSLGVIVPNEKIENRFLMY